MGAALLIALAIYFCIGKAHLQDEAIRELVESDVDSASPGAKSKLHELKESGGIPMLTLNQLHEAETTCGS